MTAQEIMADVQFAASLISQAAALVPTIRANIGNMTAAEAVDDPVALLGQVDALHADIKALGEQVDALRPVAPPTGKTS